MVGLVAERDQKARTGPEGYHHHKWQRVGAETLRGAPRNGERQCRCRVVWSRFRSVARIVLTAFISPFRSERQMACDLFEEGEFIEVFVDIPLDVAEARDPKGLYKKARRGELKNFTGIDSAYEAPEKPAVHLKTAHTSPKAAAEAVIDALRARGLIH